MGVAGVSTDIWLRKFHSYEFLAVFQLALISYLIVQSKHNRLQKTDLTWQCGLSSKKPEEFY
jgi:hypothetical protein